MEEKKTIICPKCQSYDIDEAFNKDYRCAECGKSFNVESK